MTESSIMKIQAYPHCVLAVLTFALLAATSSSQSVAATGSRPFTHYLGFINRRAIVEASTDKGLIVELIVRCPDGAGVLTYSKAERLFCTPNHRCDQTLKRAVDRLCR
jgi:hypothetical protein